MNTNLLLSMVILNVTLSAKKFCMDTKLKHTKFDLNETAYIKVSVITRCLQSVLN